MDNSVLYHQVQHTFIILHCCSFLFNIQTIEKRFPDTARHLVHKSCCVDFPAVMALIRMTFFKSNIFTFDMTILINWNTKAWNGLLLTISFPGGWRRQASDCKPRMRITAGLRGSA